MLFEKIKINDTSTLNSLIFEEKNTFNNPRPAILICPGGGYNHVSPREGDTIALHFMNLGYQAFVLNYTVMPTDKYGALREASEAMCIIRDNAEKWSVDPDKIAICGFSAGGHLAGSLGTMWDRDFLGAGAKNKPNAMILCYPVISSDETIWHSGSFKNLMGEASDYSEMSLDLNVSSATPPTFLWHTIEDTSVPVENTLRFANALQKNKIPFEMHIYPQGPHGLSLAPEYPHVATWIELAKEWIMIQFGDYRFR
ncbi:MAG: alpha/beta hydrolase [Eubacteriales bacterium]|nr:alpha/beta hydrolase [Eubacteriales bacterium]